MASSLFTDLLAPYGPLTADPLLAACAGGAAVGQTIMPIWPAISSFVWASLSIMAARPETQRVRASMSA